MTHLSGVRATSDEIQGAILQSGGDGNAAAANLSTPIPQKPSIPPSKWSRGCSKKARRLCGNQSFWFSVFLFLSLSKGALFFFFHF